jgi:hypothetical protein
MMNKKILILFFFVCHVLTFAGAQQQISQFIIPKKIYIGDTVELHYTFRASIDFFSDKNKSVSERDLNFNQFSFKTDSEKYTLKSAVLQRNGLTYTLVFIFQPWSTGVINFPAFDLSAAVYGSNSLAPYQIDLAPFTVYSVLIKGDENKIREPAAPLLVPGTMYAVYGSAAAIIVMLILIVRVLMHRADISNLWKSFLLRCNYARNAKGTLKKLNKLKKSEPDGILFCEQLELIMRSYLECRFGYPFFTVVTSHLMQSFDTITGGTMAEIKLNAAEELVSLFYRADHVRFASGSPGYVPLAEDERSSLICTVCRVVSCFEEAVPDA